MIKTVDLSIVVGALNEENRIDKSLNETAVYLKTSKLLRNKTVEIVIVIPNGVDNTKKVVESYHSKFKNLTILEPGKPVGKGRDIQYGILRAKGEKILFMDADNATPLRYIDTFYDRIDAGADLVIGTRNILNHHTSRVRFIISIIGNILFKFVSGLWIEDSQCGFKMFTRESARHCFKRLTVMKWGFDMEILTIARLAKFSIETQRIEDWKDVEGGSFDAGSTRTHIVDSLKDLILILKSRIMGSYR